MAVDDAGEGLVVGYLLGERVRNYSVVQEMAVVTERHGEGIGSELLRRFAADAADAGDTRVYVRPLPDAPGDLPSYYRQRGFTDEGPQGHFAGTPEAIVAAIERR